MEIIFLKFSKLIWVILFMKKSKIYSKLNFFFQVEIWQNFTTKKLLNQCWSGENFLNIQQAWSWYWVAVIQVWFWALGSGYTKGRPKFTRPTTTLVVSTLSTKNYQPNVKKSCILVAPIKLSNSNKVHQLI